MTSIEATIWAVCITAWLVLLAIFLQSPVKDNEKLSSTDAVKIYNDFKKFTGAPELIPELVIKDNTTINAYASSKEIIVTTGLLNFCKTKDELAFIIGHEIGHIMLDHVSQQNRILIDSRIQEANSDKFGAYLVLRAGYDVCKARDFWLRLREVNGDSTMTQSHPDYSFRDWSLNFPNCEGK